MSKSRNNKKQKPRKGERKPARPASGDAQYILSVIKTLGREANLKKLFPAVLKKMKQEEIILALYELERQGLIKMQQKGEIKLIHAKRAPTDEHRTTKFLFGIADVTKTGSAYVEVEGMDKDIYIPNRAVHGAMGGDAVKVRMTMFGRRPEGEIVEIVKRSQDSFAGRVEVLEKFAFFVADNRVLSTDVFVPLTSLNGAKNDDRVIVRITDWNKDGKKPIGEVAELLSGKTSSDLDMKLILISNGFSIDFPSAVYKELDKVSEQIPQSEIDKRLDFRDVLTMTIDPVDAKDFDDAISYRKLPNGKHEIGVHIADVAHYIHEGSALDKEAERRATSVYLPDRVCPMLPEKLSNVLCSLRPNEDKLTFAAIFEMDEQFNITHSTIARTVIHSRRRFTYEEVQEVLETGQGDHVEELQLLDKIAKTIRAKRMKNGAIAFEKDEIRFKLDETGKPIGIVLKTRKDAHLLVEDFMLLANETVAKFGSRLPTKSNNKEETTQAKPVKRASPFVYRIHDTPDPQKLETFSAVAARFGYHIKFEDPKHAAETFNTLLKKVIGKPEQNVLETMAIRSMAKAAYTTANIGHYGLAMEYYTHFTSPIRRYPDVLVHRLLEHLLGESDVIIDKEDLESRCKNSSLMERKAMDAEREAVKYKQIEYLQDKIGGEFEGVITGVIARGIFVEMAENKCEGMVSTELMGDEDFMFEEKNVRLVGTRSRKKYDLGDKVKVKIVSADIILRRIDLELVQE